MEELIIELEKLSFSKTEAAVYLSLVKHGKMNGYKIAKILNMSRSSVYSALDNLYQKGAVYLLSGESNIYESSNPDILIDRLKKEYIKSAEMLKSKISQYGKTSPKKQYFNIEGYDNIVLKCKELLIAAEKEVYLNTDFDLQIFKEEIQFIHKKGVRIIVFSFSKLNIENLPVEIYSNFSEKTICKEIRMMLVIDFKKTLIASNSDSIEFIGTFTENMMLTSIISEHIHHDIYLLKLKRKYGKDLIESDIQIQSLMETTDY